MEKFIRVPYGSTVHGDEEIAAVVEVLNTTTQMSKNVLDFEQRLPNHLIKKMELWLTPDRLPFMF